MLDINFYSDISDCKTISLPDFSSAEIDDELSMQDKNVRIE
jgi:hypothetical protein